MKRVIKNIGCPELCESVHTAERQRPTQIHIGFCVNLSVSASVSVSVSILVSGSVTAPIRERYETLNRNWP